jgi:hypothetical protein
MMTDDNTDFTHAFKKVTTLQSEYDMAVASNNANDMADLLTTAATRHVLFLATRVGEAFAELQVLAHTDEDKREVARLATHASLASR